MHTPSTAELHLFLIALRRQGFAIGIDTVIKVEQVVQAFTETTRGLSEPVNLCNVLAPVICKNALEQDRFRKLYAVWRQTQETTQPDVLPSIDSGAENVLTIDYQTSARLEETARQSRRRWILATCLFLAAGLMVWLYYTQVESPKPPLPQLPVHQTLPAPTPPKPSAGQETPQEPKPPERPDVFARTLIALLVFMIPAIYWWTKRRRLQIMQRRFTTRIPQSRAVTLETASQLFFSGSRGQEIFQLLRQHLTLESQFLDVRRTLANMLRSPGTAPFAFRDRRILPEHLLLVDRRSEEDHIRGLADLLENRLREANIPVIRYEFRQIPRTLQRWNTFTHELEETISLKDLAARYSDYRLMVLSEADGFVNTLTSQLRPWLEDFRGWTRRVILTPKPRSCWAELEELLEQDGFIMAPANTDGLQEMTHAILAAEGTAAAVFNHPAHDERTIVDPSMLDDTPSRWLENYPPRLEMIDALLEELHRFLGDRGFYWCCACAAFPKLHPELTLHLGASLTTASGETLGSEEGLLALSRLPWFRHGLMPDWLRLTLLFQMSADQKQRVRHVLTEVLMTAKSESGARLVLNISDRTMKFAVDFIGRSTARDDFMNPLSEDIFLSFLRGRELPPLAVVAPPTLVQTIRRRIEPLQTALWVGAALAAVLLWWYTPLTPPQAPAEPAPVIPSPPPTADPLPAPNQPPIAELSGPTSGVANQLLAFSAIGSSDPDADPDGNFLNYKWDFGDDTTAIFTFPRATHRYSSPGLYLVQLIVEDDKGATAIASQQILISEEQRLSLSAIVRFDSDGPVNPESIAELEPLLQAMQADSQLLARIVGHADSRGSAEFNLGLSERRAQAVADYLMDGGIGSDRLTVEGRGELDPIAPNDTPEGRQQNRRVEIVVSAVSQ